MGASKVSSGWSFKDNTNCWAGQGATITSKDNCHGSVDRQHSCGTKDSFLTNLAGSQGATCFVFNSQTNECWLRQSCDVAKCKSDCGDNCDHFAVYWQPMQPLRPRSPMVIPSQASTVSSGWSSQDNTNCWAGQGATITSVDNCHGSVDRQYSCGAKDSFQTNSVDDCTNLAGSQGATCFVFNAQTSECWLRQSCDVAKCKSDCGDNCDHFAVYWQPMKPLRPRSPMVIPSQASTVSSGWSSQDNTNCWAGQGATI